MNYIKPYILVLTLLVLFSANMEAGAGDRKKVLYINSYHQGYAWSDRITTGIQSVLEGQNIDLKIIELDTKRNTSRAFKKKAAKNALQIIEDFQPDVVIASDDNASKYIIAPFFKNKKLPFIFCGVNWDEKEYGYPYTNVTGMVEVTPVPQLLSQLKKYTKGHRIGFLGPDTLTARKEASNYKTKFNLKFKSYFAKNYADWKKGFLQLQKEVDLLILDSDGGLYERYSVEMRLFVQRNSKVPTGTTYEFMAPYAMITFAKVADEQGRWAAEQALKIINGTSPQEIPITTNRKGRLIFNLKIAKMLNIHIPDQDLEYASKIIE